MTARGRKQREDLRLSAIAALSGADYVQDQLLSLLSMGPDCISKFVYAVKCRVKSEERLLAKINQRQAERPNYSATDVTDIVGLRLLVLYSHDLLETTKRFLKFVSFCQQDKVSLFTGTHIRDTIVEIIVYQSTNTVKVYDDIYNYLRLLDLGNDDQKLPRVKLIPSKDEQPYSSIHFVLKCLSFASETPRLIFLEVQIRTVFEDAWSEIDHPLRYKSHLRTKIRSKVIKDTLKTTTDQLRNLKHQIDVLGKNADLIREQFKKCEDIAATPRKLSRGGDFSPFRVSLARTCPEEIRNRLAALAKSLNSLVSTINSPSSVDGRSSFISEFDLLRKRTNDINSLYQRKHPKIHQDDVDFFYTIKMTLGTIGIYMGRISRQLNFKDSGAWKDYLTEALRNYSALFASANSYNDCVLNFRYGHCLALLGTTDFGIDYIRRAMELFDQLDHDNEPREAANLAVTCGHVCWSRRQRLWFEGAELDNTQYALSEQRGLLYSAIVYTQAALSIALRAKSRKDNVESWATSSIDKCWANLVNYFWEIKDVDNSIDLSQFSAFKKEPIRNCIKSLHSSHADRPPQLHTPDTVMKGYDLVGDKQKASSIAGKIEEYVNSSNAIDPLLSSVDVLQIQHNTRVIKGKKIHRGRKGN